MAKSVDFDVVIIGGGPAGSCAALRLLGLGHRVALIEQELFPRKHVGESLSPGIRYIFKYLQADELLYSGQYVDGLPSCLIWETQTPVHMTAEQRGEGLMVSRGKLDKDLIQLAVQRGLKLFQPARFESCNQTDTGWLVTLKADTVRSTIKTTFILDARGRKGVRLQDRIITAPATIVLYADMPATDMPHCTLIEAKNEGWLWGSPLPDKQFRMMAFLRPDVVKKAALNETFTTILSGSQLFQPGIGTGLTSKIQTCLLQNYSHNNPWETNYIRLGETAFTLDPLSSTGVEKAMRLSLQAVIAVNTILQGGNIHLAKDFFEAKMIESIVTHRFWTRNYYAAAWPGQQQPFWNERSQDLLNSNGLQTEFHTRLLTEINNYQEARPRNIQTTDIHVNSFFTCHWHDKISVAKDLLYIQTSCVVNDQLETKTAVKLDPAEKEIAYLEDIEILPLLALIDTLDTLGDLIYKWTRKMSFEQAKRIAIGLFNLQIICKADLQSLAILDTF